MNKKNNSTIMVALVLLIIGICWGTYDGIVNVRLHESSQNNRIQSTINNDNIEKSNNNSTSLANEYIKVVNGDSFYYRSDSPYPYRHVYKGEMCREDYYYQINDLGQVEQINVFYYNTAYGEPFKDNPDYSVSIRLGYDDKNRIVQHNLKSENENYTALIEYDDLNRVIRYKRIYTIPYSSVEDYYYAFASKDGKTYIKKSIKDDAYIYNYEIYECNNDEIVCDFTSLSGIGYPVYEEYTLLTWRTNGTGHYQITNYYDDSYYCEINGVVSIDEIESPYSHFNYDGKASDYNDIIELFDNEDKKIEDNNLNTFEVNKPVLNGMVPVKLVNGVWIACDENDSDWYDYSNAGSIKYATAKKNKNSQEIYVWIPRYTFNPNTNEIVYSKGIKDYTENGFITQHSFFDSKTNAPLMGIWTKKN